MCASVTNLPVRQSHDGRLIGRAIERSGVAGDSDDAFLHIFNAAVGIEWVTGISLRRVGTRLDKEALRSAGLRGNAIITEEFLGCLNETGRVDPMASGDTLAHTINVCRSSWGDITGHARSFGKERPIYFWPSYMLAGPCDVAKAIGDQELSIEDAVLLPLAGCSHPGQCWCFYRQSARERQSTPTADDDLDLSAYGISIIFRGD